MLHVEGVGSVLLLYFHSAGLKLYAWLFKSRLDGHASSQMISVKSADQNVLRGSSL